LRFGVPAELVDQSMDPEVRAGFEGVIDRLRAAGHGVEPVSLPILLESMQLGPQILGIVESGSIIEESLMEFAGSDPELRQAVTRAQQISGLTTARSYHRVAVLRSKLRQTFEEVDFLLTPTLPCRVPDGSTPDVEVELDVGGATETRTSALTRLVNPWNLASLPAGTLPIARDDGGAAVSLQVVGPSFSDWKILDVMEFVEDALGGPWDTVSPPD
jgi:aspartyl-tRNA(Asn)/glutamyl-tRNA(Gln) amidotransferase subunit A